MKKAIVLLTLLLSLVVAEGAYAHTHVSSYRYTSSGHHCRSARVEVDRHGALFGGELWYRAQRVSWCVSRAGYVTWAKRTLSYGHNSFWEYAGDAWRDSNAHWNSRYFGVRSHFQGWIGPKVTGIYENNWPQITMTVYGDLHFTYRGRCGC